MSIAFRKKDYQYDGDDIEYEDVPDDDLEDDENTLNQTEFRHKATAMPADWIMNLYSDLKEVAYENVVEIFDKLDPVALAEFVGEHTTERVFT